MRIMKKSCLLAVVVTLVVNSIGVVAAADITNGILPFESTFEGYSSGIPSCFDAADNRTNLSAGTEAERGTFLNITPAGKVTRLYKYFNTNVNSGVLNIGFDFCVTGTANTTYLRLFTEDYVSLSGSDEEDILDTFRTRAISGGGYKVSCHQNSCTNTYIDLFDYAELSIWHRANMWIDLNSSTVYYLVDGNYVGKTGFNTCKGLIGLVFTSSGASGSSYLDNVNINMLSGSDISACTSVPQEFSLPYINISSRKTGNIFFQDDEVALDINFDYFGNTPSGSFEVKILDYDGAVIETKTVTPSGSPQYRVSFKPQQPLKYGTYKLKVFKDGAEVKSADFAYSRKSEKKSDRYGTNVALDYRRGYSQKIMPLVKNAGFGITRNTWNNKVVGDTTAPAALTANMQRYVTESTGKNIDLLAQIAYVGQKYNAEQIATDINAFNWFKEYAQNFAQAHPEVLYFEVGNEINNWKDSDKTERLLPPTHYAKCLEAAYKGIKAANTGAKIIAFALNDQTYLNFDKDYADETIAALIQNEAGICFDAISTHPYNVTSSLENGVYPQYKSWKEQAQEVVDAVNSLRAKYNIEKEIEIWATEIGWYTDPYVNTNTVSRLEQASRYIKTMIINDAGKYFDRMQFYDFQNDGVSTDNKNHNLGIINSFVGVDTPYSAKPAYVAVANFNSLLADAECELYTEGSSLRGSHIARYKRRSDDATIYAVWDVSMLTSSCTLDAGESEYVNVYDLFGNKTVQAVDASGKVTISTSEEPKFVEIVNKDFKTSVVWENFDKQYAGYSTGSLVNTSTVFYEGTTGNFSIWKVQAGFSASKNDEGRLALGYKGANTIRYMFDEENFSYMLGKMTVEYKTFIDSNTTLIIPSLLAGKVQYPLFKNNGRIVSFDNSTNLTGTGWKGDEHSFKYVFDFDKKTVVATVDQEEIYNGEIYNFDTLYGAGVVTGMNFEINVNASGVTGNATIDDIVITTEYLGDDSGVYVRDFKLVSNGTASATVSARVFNTTAEDTSACVAGGVYASDKFIDVAFDEQMIDKYSVKNLSASLTGDVNTTLFKGFLWNSLSQLKPMSEPIVSH